MVSLGLLFGFAAFGACPSVRTDPVEFNTDEVILGCPTLALWGKSGGPNKCAPLPNPPPPSADGKQSRDAYGSFPSQRETPNFIIKWGALDGFSFEDVDALAEALETSWSHEIDALGYPVPLGANTYKVNVYIGDTHPLSPPINANAKAYVNLDPDGYPQLVFSGKHLGNHSTVSLTAAHEFFHAIQWHANDDYAYGPEEPASWYWEATAVWMENEVFSDNLEYGRHIASFLFYPEYPLNFFTLPSTGALSETHAYGAFLFPRYLSEHGPGHALLRESFTDSKGQDDPLDVLDRLMKDSGTSLNEQFFSFIQRNATLNYAHRASYIAHLDTYGGYLSVYSHRPSGVLSDYNDQWKSNLEDFPVSLSANYWEIRPTQTPFTIDIESFDEGEWHAAIVTFDGSTHTVKSTTWTGKEQVALDMTATAHETWLVVGLHHSEAPQRAHPYQVRLRSQDPDTGDHSDDDTGPNEEPNGCQCSGQSRSSIWLLGLCLLLSSAVQRRTLRL